MSPVVGEAIIFKDENLSSTYLSYFISIGTIRTLIYLILFFGHLIIFDTEITLNRFFNSFRFCLKKSNFVIYKQFSIFNEINIYFLNNKKSPSINPSKSEFFNVNIASCGEQTIGRPCKFNEVFSNE